MGSHEILKSRLQAIFSGTEIDEPRSDLLLGLKGTPNFKFMGLSASYGWYRKFSSGQIDSTTQMSMFELTRKRLLDCFARQRSEFMLEEQCAPDPHFEFYLASVGVAGEIAHQTGDREMLTAVKKWLSDFVYIYSKGEGINSRDPKHRLLFVPGMRTEGRFGVTDPTSQVADSLYRLLLDIPKNRAEEKAGYYGKGGVKDLGLYSVKGLLDKGAVHLTVNNPPGLRIPVRWWNDGHRIISWFDATEPVSGVGPCYWLDADLHKGKVTKFSVKWDILGPELPRGGMGGNYYRVGRKP